MPMIMPVMAVSISNLPRIVVGAACCLLAASGASAFNSKAHRVAGYVAEANMCKQTLAAVSELDPERNIAAAGTWADEIRRFKHFDRVKPWHYINIPDSSSVRAALSGKRSGRGDVLFAIDHFDRLLRDKSADRLDRAMAYRFLVHFIADVHQPLHVGRKEDLGGNRVKVRVEGQRTNLHAYWDGFDLNKVIDNPDEYAQYLQRLYAEKTAASGGTPADWAQESMDYRARVYAMGGSASGDEPVLDRSYRNKAIEIINLRIYQAGLRIAGALDAVFCDVPGNKASD